MNVIGLRFGDGLQVLREIDRGALARVFLASDGTRVVAVKLFPVAQKAHAERELESGRGLDHPNLNTVEAAVTLGGFPGVLMPVVPGTRLGRWLAEGPGTARFLRVLAAVLDGLAYLHERGIVHRDVKPENILVDKLDHPRLVDFDLSVAIGDATQVRAVAGTVAYLSPEQTRAESVTPASDLYSVGVILYWGLTGEVPFSGSVAEVIEAHRHAEAPPVSTFDPELAPFDAVLKRALAKEPAARYQHAAEFGRELLSRLPR